MSAGAGQLALRAGATGGLVFADGHFFATRKVDQSFALAEVAGYGGIGIGLGSNMLTRTDATGVALVTQLIPYQENPIRLDARELPVSAEIDSIEQMVVPRYRSAVKAVFPVRSGRGALVKIVLDDGEAAPAGALVNIVNDDHEFYVARRGEAFVTGLKDKDRLRLRWNKQACDIDIVLPPAAKDEIARVGPFACKGVKR
jgi:outer membrane usher protein